MEKSLESLVHQLLSWSNFCLKKKSAWIGLDPADGTWDLDNTDTRLDISDAEFVDIMHTNAGNASGGGIAFGEPIGHVDFYVNGGQIQPGCNKPDVSKSMFCPLCDIILKSFLRVSIWNVHPQKTVSPSINEIWF